MSNSPQDALQLVEGASIHDDRSEIIRPAFVRFYDRLTEGLFNASMVLMLTAMTLLIGMDVLLRVFAGTPIRGTHDLVGLCMLLLFLLALPHSWRGGHHVRMDMVYGAMPRWGRKTIDIFAALAAIVFGLMLAYQAWKYIPSFQRRGTSTVTLGIPVWPFTVAIAISAALFTVSVVIDLFMTIFGRRRRSET